MKLNWRINNNRIDAKFPLEVINIWNPWSNKTDANLENRQSSIYYAGLLGRWDKRVVDQESDVPSIIFLILFIDLGNSKLFIFIFVTLLRLGAQSVTLLSTLRDPTQLRRHPCAFRKQPLLFVPMKAKNSNSYCSSEGRNRLNPKKYS